MRLLFLAVLALAVLTVPAAYAEIEKGKDYDRTFLGLTPDGRETYQMTSHPERIWDGSWVDYKITDNQNNIRYDSANLEASVSKETCNLNIYNSEGISKLSISHTAKTAQNGTDVWNVLALNEKSCTISTAPSEESVVLTATKDDTILGLGLKFDVDYLFNHGTLKETYRLKNMDMLKSDDKFGFTTLFLGNVKLDIDGQTYDTADQIDVSVSPNDLHGLIRIYDDSGFEMYFDPQNYIHNYLWVIKIQQGKIIFDFTYSKGKLPFGETLTVDPIYDSATSGAAGVYPSVGSGTNCASLTGNTAYAPLFISKNTGVTGCIILWTEWDTSAIPASSTVNSAYVQWDQSGSLNWISNCGLYAYGTQPSTLTVGQRYAQGWTGVGSGTNSTCTTDGAGKQIWLNSTGISNLQTNIQGSEGWWGAMLQSVSPIADGTSREFSLATVKLHIVYTASPANPPTSLSCDSQARKVLCTWTAPTPVAGSQNGVDTIYLGRSLDNSTFTNKTSAGNVTSSLLTGYFAVNKLYYMNATASDTGAANSTSSNHASFTTDNFPSAPQNPYTTPMSGSVIKINYSPPSSAGNDSISGYRIDYCITCTSWTTLINSTNTLNYNQTGLAIGQTVKYRMAAWNGVGISAFTANFTGKTHETTSATITLSNGIIGDTAQINATVSVTAGSPSPVSVIQSRLYSNGSLVETRAESESVNVPGSVTLDPFWYRMTTGNVYALQVRVTVTNATGNIAFNGTSNESREYNPTYINADDDPAVEGLVNYTLSRFDSEDGILLHVNRVAGTLGTTWTLNCITQTNTEAQATRNQSLTWPGTWNNYTGVGYGNTTWTGFRNTHGYVTCFNPPGQLFTTISYTNSSLALFGIEVFDNSYGAMLGVPVGIFFLAMAGGMANKRTAPTWIVVLLGMAGVMATIGFFTISPIVWGLALVTGLLGLLVNQKVF